MDLLRRHLFLIICVLVTGGGIALGVVGFKAEPGVKAEMEKAKSVYQSLDALSSNPVNRARIDAERRRIELIREDHERMIERARAMYGWELLVPGVLPEGNATQRLEFKARYGDAMRALFESLTAGEPANDIDIRNMRDRIASEQAAVKEHDVNPLIPLPVIHTGPPRDAAGVLTLAGAQQDPVARAHLQAAQRIYCYAKGFVPEQPTLGIYPSLDFDAVMANVDTVDPPYSDEVWNAQLGYWIQKDVVETIVALNAEAASQAEARGEYGWVGVLPVKEVVSVRVGRSLIPPDSDPIFSPPVTGFEPAWPTGSPAGVFTQNGSGESFDVVQFAVKLVMDQRDVLRFIEKLCNHRFYVPLRVAYTAVPVNRNMVGKIYGSEPAVIVVMEFELPLLGEVFRRWMPSYIREQYHVVCRPQDECDATP